MEQDAGEIVEKAVRRSGISIAELARRINVDRRTIYYWFKQINLSVDTISKIGEGINHDFSNDFPELTQQLNQITLIKNHVNKDSDVEVIRFWKHKYISLLEKYNEMLTQKSPDR
jgi:transcriptional regulator with XRE-family HTH domain